MRENVFPHVGIQETLTGNEGIHRAQEYSHIFPAQLWGKALQEHSLHMGVFFVWGRGWGLFLFCWTMEMSAFPGNGTTVDDCGRLSDVRT